MKSPNSISMPAKDLGAPAATPEKLTSTVLIPTYRRPQDLERCLDALVKQTLQADRILVVHRKEDVESRETIDKWTARLPIEQVLVERPGQVVSLNSGLERVSTDVICILDDDTAAHVRWLERIHAIFATQRDVGGVGGRDHIYIDGKLQTGNATDVGIIRWYGRFVGKHHLGNGARRDVDYLKGANMSYRVDAIGQTRFDTRLLGSGAQVHNDLVFSMAIRNRGWRLVYDPEVAVDHFCARRLDSDQRGCPSLDAAENMAYNFYLALFYYVRPPCRKFMTVLYARLVGLKHSPGLLRGFWYWLRSNSEGLAFRMVAIRAWEALRRHRTEDIREARKWSS